MVYEFLLLKFNICDDDFPQLFSHQGTFVNQIFDANKLQVFSEGGIISLGLSSLDVH